jgi:hypothetical protein
MRRRASRRLMTMTQKNDPLPSKSKLKFARGLCDIWHNVWCYYLPAGWLTERQIQRKVEIELSHIWSMTPAEREKYLEKKYLR